MELSLASGTQSFHKDSVREFKFSNRNLDLPRLAEVLKNPTEPAVQLSLISMRQSNVNHLLPSLSSTRFIGGITESFQEHFKVCFAAVPVAEDCIFHCDVLLQNESQQSKNISSCCGITILINIFLAVYKCPQYSMQPKQGRSHCKRCQLTTERVSKFNCRASLTHQVGFHSPKTPNND